MSAVPAVFPVLSNVAGKFVELLVCRMDGNAREKAIATREVDFVVFNSALNLYLRTCGVEILQSKGRVLEEDDLQQWRCRLTSQATAHVNGMPTPPNLVRVGTGMSNP
jgi:hypothetical protein